MMKLPYRYRRTLVLASMVPILLMAACGGSDDTPVAESTAVTQPNSPTPDASDIDGDGDVDEQVICDLLSNDEIREATGFEVASAEGNTSALPTCDWELSVPESAGIVGLPVLSVVLLPESDYRSRVDPLGDGLQEIDGLDYEVKFHYAAGNADSGIPARMYFFALNGNQGIQILAGFALWDSEEAAKSALLDMADKIFNRA